MGGEKGAATSNSKAKKKQGQKPQNLRSKPCSRHKFHKFHKGVFVPLHDELSVLGLRIKPVSTNIMHGIQCAMRQAYDYKWSHAHLSANWGLCRFWLMAIASSEPFRTRFVFLALEPGLVSTPTC